MKRPKKFQSIRVKLVRRIEWIILLCLVVTVVFSLFFLSPVMAEQTLQRCEQGAVQMANYLDTSFNTIANFANSVINSNELEDITIDYIKNPGDEGKRSQLRLRLHEFLTQLSSVRGMVLELPGGVFVDSITGVFPEDLAFLRSEWYESNANLPGSKKFSNFYRISESQTTSSATSGAYCISFWFKTHEVKLTVFFDTFHLLYNLNNVAQNYFDDYTLLSSDRTPQTVLTDPDSTEPVTEQAWQGSHPDGEFFDIYPSSNSWNWSVLAFIENASINSTYSSLLVFILITYALLSALVLFSSRAAIGHLIVPLAQLSDSMKQVSKGDWQARASIHTNDEIESLSNIFNETLFNLNYYFNASLEKEKEKQQMRYNLLLAQLDPHFIYNAMSIITVLARRTDNQEIVEINTALISFLRDRLRLSNADMTDTVEKEIEALKQYIYIANFRFRDHPVAVTWEIDPAALSVTIPKVVLQTIVENCFKHGFIDPRVSYHLSIRIQSLSGGIQITVSDDGAGIGEETLAKLNNASILQTSERGRHIGIGNMRELLRYLYGDGFSLVFRRAPGGGTVVEIFLGSRPGSI